MLKTAPETSDVLTEKMLAIFSASAVADKKAKAADRAQRQLTIAKSKTSDAVRDYNLAIAEQIIEALVAEGLGLCQTSSSDFHIAEEAGMMGIIRTGTRTRGDHYHEHDEHYVDTKLKCKDCRANITIRRGNDSLVELDARVVWTKLLRSKFSTIYSLHYLKDLLAWANERGISAMPITRQGSGGRDHYKLGDVDLPINGRHY